MNIISQLDNDVQQDCSSGMFSDEHHIKMDSYVAHTAYFDDYDNWGSYWRRLVVAPTGGGKTKAVIEHVLANEEQVLILVDNLMLGRQIAAKYDLPFHCAETPQKSTTPRVVTVYNHVAHFCNPRRVVIFDETHSQIAQLGFRRECIEDLVAVLDGFDRVIGLTGTFIPSQTFRDWHITFFERTTAQPTTLTLVRYPHLKNVIEIVARLALQEVMDGRQVLIYLQNKGSLLDELMAQLKVYMPNRVLGMLNSETVGEELNLNSDVINDQRFVADVLVTSYAQGYSILNENVSFICFPNVDYISLVQAIARVRTPLVKAYFLTNATDKSKTFNDAWDEVSDTYVEKAYTLWSKYRQMTRSERHFHALVKHDSEAINLIGFGHKVNFDEVAYRTISEISSLMKDDLLLLTTTLAQFGIDVSKQMVWSNEDLNKLNVIKPNNTKASRTEVTAEALKAIDSGGRLTSKQFEVKRRLEELKSCGASDDEARNLLLTRWNAYDRELLRLRVKNDKVGPTATLRQLLTAKFVSGQFYMPDQILSVFCECAAGVGITAVDKNIAFAILSGLYDVERIVKRVDGQLIGGYTLNTDDDW